MQTSFSPPPRGVHPGSVPQGRGCKAGIPSGSIKFASSASGGFSLIEVTLALGVVAFAFVALFGMLPVGLNAFNNSIDSTMEAQIAQSLMSQLRQAKFSQLYAQYNDTSAVTSPSFYKSYSQPYTAPQGFPAYYFDDQGNPAVASGTTNPQTTPPPSYVYCAGVQVYYDTWTVAPGAATSPPFGVQPENTAVTATSVNPVTPQPVATVIITIVKFSSPYSARIYTGYIGNNGF